MRTGLMAAVVGIAGSLAMGSGASAGSENAALEYYRAMAMGGPDDATSFIDQSGEKLKLTDAWKSRTSSDVDYEILHRAASMDDVDWGIDSSEGPMTLLPHLGFMRQASRYLAAEALESAERNETEWVSQNIATIHRMGIHVATDDVLISSLVGMAIQNLGIRVTNQLIDDGKIDAAGARVIADAIRNGDSPDRFGMRDTIVGEWRMIGEYIMKNAPEDNTGEWLQELTMYAGESEPGEQVLKMTRTEMIRELGGFAVYHSDLLRAWDAQDASMFEAAEQRVQEGEYGALTELLGATYTRSFSGHVQIRKDLDALIQRLEEIAD